MTHLKLKNLFTILLCFIILLPVVFLSGCFDEAFSIYFGVEEMPYNLDPQKAETYGELLAVRNCFKGLFKEDSDNNIVPDLVDTYTVSDDKLTYTFRLKTAKWKDGTEITADDFIFAVSRAKDPVTASASKELVENIEKMAEIDSKSFIFKLKRPDENFLKTLTSAVFKPCNRKFFEKSGGKYGLSRQYLLTNGDYSVASWNDRQIKLRLTENHERINTAPENVFITVSSTGKNSVERINDKEIGMAVNTINDWSSVDNSKYSITQRLSKVYALIFNKNTEVGRNENLTSAFAKSIHKEYYSVRMSKRFSVPKSVILNDTLLPAIPPYEYQFDSTAARDEFLEALKDFKNKKLPSISVLTAQSSDINSVLRDIVSQWQSHLGAYVNVTTLKNEDILLSTVKSGGFTVALVPLNNDEDEILKLLTDNTSGIYLNNGELDKAATDYFEAHDFSKKIKALTDAAMLLSKETSVIPIVSAPTSYIVDKTYNNVVFSAVDSTVDFTIIYK